MRWSVPIPTRCWVIHSPSCQEYWLQSSLETAFGWKELPHLELYFSRNNPYSVTGSYKGTNYSLYKGPAPSLNLRQFWKAVPAPESLMGSAEATVATALQFHFFPISTPSLSGKCCSPVFFTVVSYTHIFVSIVWGTRPKTELRLAHEND